MKRLFVFIFMWAVFLSACSTGRWIKTPVLEEKNLTVSLEHRMEKEQIIAKNYHHPYKINPLALHKLLADLIYIEESGFWQNQTENPVFQKIEVDRIAPALTDALSRATSDQRIYFTSYNRGGGLLFKNRRKTEGVIFIDPDSNLNIALAHINLEMEPSNKTELPGARVDPLKIKSSETALLPLSPFATIRKDKSGMPIPMWIVVDLDKLQATGNVEPQPLSQKSKQKSQPKSSLKATTNTGKMGAKPLVRQPAQTTEEITDVPQQKRIKYKLSYLKELFDASLINKQEYEAKKKEVLDTFN